MNTSASSYTNNRMEDEYFADRNSDWDMESSRDHGSISEDEALESDDDERSSSDKCVKQRNEEIRE